MAPLIVVVAGCQPMTPQGPGVARILTGLEMDEVTAGSAVAVNESAAHARGFAPQTEALGIASAISGNSPIVGAPFVNYANSQATASAGGGQLAQTGLSSHVSVDSANGGASIDAKAASTGTSRAQVTAQFYGISTNRGDLVFGSVAAAACCGFAATAQVNAASEAGGHYSTELRSATMSDTAGQVQRTVDIAVVSSAVPTVDPAQVLVSGGPARISPKY